MSKEDNYIEFMKQLDDCIEFEKFANSHKDYISLQLTIAQCNYDIFKNISKVISNNKKLRKQNKKLRELLKEEQNVKHLKFTKETN